MDIRTEIKTLVLHSKTTLKYVAEEMTKRTGTRYPSSTLSLKLSNETLHYKEAKLIGEILGYELKFEKKK